LITDCIIFIRQADDSDRCDGNMLMKNNTMWCEHICKCAFVGLSRRCECKAVPLRAWNGPEGYRKLWFPDFMKTAQDGVKVINLTHRPPLPPGNTPGTHFC